MDFNQVALANIFQFQSDLKKSSNNPEAANIIRHAVITGIKSFKKAYGAKYGEVVIACDGKNYWRKSIFPYYKAGRSKARSRIDIDWDVVFGTIDSVREDLHNYFPYRTIHLDTIEADDIIATLCKWTQTNGHVDRGMFEEKQTVLIVSSDGDFKQLHAYDNVRQWSPTQKKFVNSPHPKSELLEKIATGDSGDGIPNVLSSDDVLVTEGVRQKKMMKSRLEQFTERGRDACVTDEERRNWDRNNQLINLATIPAEIEQKIVDTYVNNRPKGDKMSVYEYLVKHRMRLLLSDVDEF